jgi:uncharacterized protein YjiS (DUF1127 family)
VFRAKGFHVLPALADYVFLHEASDIGLSRSNIIST